MDSATAPASIGIGTSGNTVISTRLTVTGRVLDVTAGSVLAGATVTLAGVSATTAADGTFTLPDVDITVSSSATASKVGYASKTFTVTAAADVSRVNVGDISLQAYSTLTIQRLQPAAIANGTSNFGVDEPLVPVTTLSALASSGNAALVQGLVADGVTPLLIYLRNRESTAVATYRLSGSVLGGGSIVGGLTARLGGLQNGNWTYLSGPGNGEVKMILTGVSTGDPDRHGFAYLNAIPAESVVLAAGSQEVNCQVLVEELDASGATVSSKTVPFKIRKPPIVLVHGYNANSSAWSSAFLAEFNASRPADFVKKIEYGVTVAANGWVSNSLNTDGRLDYLAAVLDGVLKNQVENATSTFFNSWAMTRYDVVAHSQGGVVTRMLCQNVGTNLPLFASTPFRDSSNSYRGRFRRVVTIGSPHNGSRTAYYLFKLKETPFLILPAALQAFGLLQAKFDPYGEQVRQINNPLSQADPAAKFHLITAAIEGGSPPLAGAIVPTCYSIIPGFNLPPAGSGIPRGATVLPRGSDGVVDLDSAAGTPVNGGTSNKTSPMGFDICHAPAPGWVGGYTFFGVGDGESLTNEPQVAVRALSLLDGPATAFGPFILPRLLTDQSAINAIMPSVSALTLDVILLSTSGAQAARGLVEAAATTTSYSYQLRPSVSEPLQGKVTWFAEAFAPNGSSTDGITVQVNATNSTLVTVTVDGSVQGDVVLYAHYLSTTGKLIVGKPIAVVSRPTTSALTAIEISPSTVALGTGQTQQFQIWGTYNTGARSLLFVPPGSGLQLVSSAPAIASIDANNILTANSLGIATVTATYKGLTAKRAVGIHGPPLTATYSSAAVVPVTAASYSAAGNTASFALNFAPAAGTNLPVVKNTGMGFINGTFSNLAQGQAVRLTFGGVSYDFVANYYGGTGNDLVLQWANTRPVAWGLNTSAQLGNNTTANSLVPVAVNTAGVLSGKTIIAVSADVSHGLALCSDGTLAAWGSNSWGTLGNNSTTDSSVPAAVDTSGVLAGKTVIAVSAGSYHSLALCSDGTFAAWGLNTSAQLGNNTTANSLVPVAVNTAGVLSGKTVISVSAGATHSLALCSDGTVVAWGGNGSGQLGNNSTTDSLVPVAVNATGVLSGKTVVAVSAGSSHSLALLSNGTVAAWGNNYSGLLGNNSTINSSVPVLVNTAGVLAGKTVIALSAGRDHSLALCSDGTVAAWGFQGFGALGNNSTTSSMVPVAVSTAGVLAGKTVIAVSAGGSHSLALCSDGTLTAWGYNYHGELGTNDTANRYTPTAVSAATLTAGERFATVVSGQSGYFSLGLIATPPSPILTTLAPTTVTGTGATLNGLVNANGLNTAVSFDYGLTTAYGTNVLATPTSVPASTTSTVSASISGLTPGATYHYRVKGTSSGTANGADLTFTNVIGTALTAQETWRQMWFNSPLNSGNGADNFDFDKDGLVNLIEFALGLNPTLGSSMQLPARQRIGNNFVINFTQPAGVSGLTYGAEWSTDDGTAELDEHPGHRHSAATCFHCPHRQQYADVPAPESDGPMIGR